MARLVIGANKSTTTPALLKIEGIIPQGTLDITENGTYNVSEYASAEVNTPVAPTYYIEKALDANGKAINSSHLMNFNAFTDVDNYVFSYAYYGNTSITGAINFNSLIQLSGNSACSSMFYGCTGITSANLNSLEVINSSNGCYSMFQGCTNLTDVDLSSLTTVNGTFVCSNMFYGCSNLTNINLDSLTIINGMSSCSSLFAYCINLPSVTFSSLTQVNSPLSWTFQSCYKLKSLVFSSLTNNSFGSSTDSFNNMLNYVPNCTIHFPNNIQSKISTLSGYPNFGGTNTVLLFDLPATNILTGVDSNIYSRNPKYDTQTALAWKIGAYGTTNFTPYYTSTTTDPQVGDTIYSDIACTTAVTTISTIA